MGMPGVTLGEFRDALTDAFNQAGLAQLVRIHLNETLQNIVAPGPTGEIAFDLIMWADQQSTPVVVELTRAVYAERPRNDKVRLVYPKLGMASGLLVEPAGTEIPQSPTRATA